MFMPQIVCLIVAEMKMEINDGNFTHGYRYPRIPPTWTRYGHNFIPTGSTHTLLVKSLVGNEYSLVPMDIPIPYPPILTCYSQMLFGEVCRELMNLY